MTKDSCCHLTELMVNCQFDATLCIFYIVHFVRERRLRYWHDQSEILAQAQWWDFSLIQ